MCHKKSNFLRAIVAITMMFTGWLPSLAHDFEVDGVYYNITCDQEVEVTYFGDSYDSFDDEYEGNVVIPSSVNYNGITYSVTSIGNYAFRLCTSLTSIEIPNSVTSIGDSAFNSCTGLTSIEIPNSVTSIGDDAFSWCDLTEIKCWATTPPTIESYTFSNYSADLYVPVGCKSAYHSANYWKNFNIINATLDNPITLNDNNVTVASIGDYIVVKNSTVGSVVCVYAAVGALIAS